MNVSDSDASATALERDGFEMMTRQELSRDRNFNTCSVREKAEHKLYTWRS